MTTLPVVIRAAAPTDLEALVRLRQAAESAARDRGIRHLVAPIQAANAAALAFYSPAGYRDVGRITAKDL